MPNTKAGDITIGTG